VLLFLVANDGAIEEAVRSGPPHTHTVPNALLGGVKHDLRLVSTDCVRSWCPGVALKVNSCTRFPHSEIPQLIKDLLQEFTLMEDWVSLSVEQPAVFPHKLNIVVHFLFRIVDDIAPAYRWASIQLRFDCSKIHGLLHYFTILREHPAVHWVVEGEGIGQFHDILDHRQSNLEWVLWNNKFRLRLFHFFDSW